MPPPPIAAAEVELTLLRLVVAGAVDATPEALWTTFVQRQQPVLRATARRITGDVVMADDAVQETLIAFWRHASRLDVHDAAQVQAWLLRVVANAARRQLRRAVTVTDTPTEALAVLPAHEPEEPPALAGLRQHLDGLPEIHRRVLELRFLDQCSYDELATALGVNEAAARKRVDRALDELRLRLRRDGVTAPAVLALLGTGEATRPWFATWSAQAGLVGATVLGAGALAWRVWPAPVAAPSAPAAVAPAAVAPALAPTDAMAAFIAAFQADHPAWREQTVTGAHWVTVGGRWSYDAKERHWQARLDPRAASGPSAGILLEQPVDATVPILIALEVRSEVKNDRAGFSLGWYGPRRGSAYPGGAAIQFGLRADHVPGSFTWNVNRGPMQTDGWSRVALRCDGPAMRVMVEGEEQRLEYAGERNAQRLPAVRFWNIDADGSAGFRRLRVLTAR